MEPLLQVEHLSVSFSTEQGRLQALDDVSFHVMQGEVLAIVGESGSGKSVTALSVLGLLPSPPAKIDSGRILFSPGGAIPTDLAGMDRKRISAVRGKHISMIFQEPMTSLNPVMTCGEQVAEVIRCHEGCTAKEAKQKTIRLFDRVRLPSPASMYGRFPHQLSGGQKQRIMIAIAMSCRPDLLIADEPTTALDVTVQKAIIELIRGLQREDRMGVMFITHDLGIVSEIADRVLVMYKGRIVETGPVNEVLTHPRHPYTRALLACRPGLQPKGTRLPVVSDFIREDDPPLAAQPRKDVMPDKTSAKALPETSQAIMEVQNLRVWFPGGTGKEMVKALDDISFSIQEGETLGLVGESGCGKTTLGRTLLGLIRPSKGSILFRGHDLAHIPADEWKKRRKELQIVFQDPYGSLNPRMTIGKAIEEPLLVHGSITTQKQRRDKVVELLEKVDMKAAHFHRYPHEFSGGQRQRIGIARALALDPGFIVFDESVSALDVSVQAQVLNLLNDLKNTLGFTAIFISHDLSVVHHISDRIIVMQEGHIIESGTADGIFHHPKEPYTRALVEAIPGKALNRWA
jgi:peptide/nickel transport system ATP-binding protein